MNDPKRIIVIFLVFIMVTIGILSIKVSAEYAGYKKQVLYTTAIQVTDKEHFNYAVDSQQGNLLANGQFNTESKDLVKFPEMTKAFTYVERTKEHYTMHTQTYTCGKSTCIRTYYSWDAIDNESLVASNLELFGREYNINLFKLDNYNSSQSCAGITANNTS
jgi:hypothetical protein